MVVRVMRVMRVMAVSVSVVTACKAGAVVDGPMAAMERVLVSVTVVMAVFSRLFVALHLRYLVLLFVVVVVVVVVLLLLLVLLAISTILSLFPSLRVFLHLFFFFLSVFCPTALSFFAAFLVSSIFSLAVGPLLPNFLLAALVHARRPLLPAPWAASDCLVLPEAREVLRLLDLGRKAEPLVTHVPDGIDGLQDYVAIDVKG